MPMKATCQLSDSPDEESYSRDGDKENEVNATQPGRKSKWKGGTAGRGKGLSNKRQKVNQSAENPESPPIFTFKTAKTSFRKRKQLKLEKLQEEDEKNKKRIEDLIAYFKNLDEQKLELA
ncbi:hypothetical protein V7S43_001288 [Phytophthora oleae]|uniref:Uncharacterized protein n=1 Tax=Phytophthora oleae TaxID=2107226 RepID=A0ABD3G6X8_9STRA